MYEEYNNRGEVYISDGVWMTPFWENKPYKYRGSAADVRNLETYYEDLRNGVIEPRGKRQRTHLAAAIRSLKHKQNSGNFSKKEINDFAYHAVRENGVPINYTKKKLYELSGSKEI